MSRINRRNLWLIVSLLVVTLGVSKLTERRFADSLATPLEDISQNIAGWSLLKAETLDERTLDILRPTSYLARVYQKNGKQLDLFIAYYAAQRAGENMHSPKNCLPGSGWDISRQGSTTIDVQGQPTRINAYAIQRVTDHALVLYWYQSKERILASEFMGKIMLVRDSIVHGHTAGLIARITVPDNPGDTVEAKVFASRLAAELQHCFGPGVS